jgi:hypothetical protein
MTKRGFASIEGRIMLIVTWRGFTARTAQADSTVAVLEAASGRT